MKDYYSILGLSSTASATEIKRVYRRLAVMYHPDKNPSPDAEALFKEINEAYDVLGDPEKKQLYDQRMQNPFQELFQQEQEPVVQHRDPRYRRKRPPGYRPPTTSRYTTRDLMKEYLPKVIVFAWAGTLTGILLIADYFLPLSTSTQTVSEAFAVYKSGRYGGRRHVYDLLKTKEGAEIKIYDGTTQLFSVGSTISLERTRIFSTHRFVSNEKYRVKLSSIYGPVGIIPLVLFITSLLGVYFRSAIEFAFNLSIVSGILLIISLYLIFAL